jgi:hypothetical protein
VRAEVRPATGVRIPGVEPDSLVAAIFAASPDIRYVALYRANALSMWQRPGVLGASSNETDRYEELFVNPVLLKLTTQRGNLDCGGLRYLLVRYGNFFQLVHPIPEGHLSVCIVDSDQADPLEVVVAVRSVLQHSNLLDL